MNIGIIGAGPGGLSAALILQKQGHNVTLYEKRGLSGALWDSIKFFRDSFGEESTGEKGENRGTESIVKYRNK